ncbi:hypothetical protein B7P43_G09842 [Cryptotermes secundus]|uniref:Chitin-binding type-2 domain-containing protein n=2 Tax=Cryptotermes secundus TaxID=105785 RepID=A0A2J7Q375_9NEOP|nr:hypothetical protein B7P43_G09842 [Cryptotermes secundus]
MFTITPDRYHSKYTDIPLRSGGTVSDYSDIPTTEKLETNNQKHEDNDSIYRKRDGTLRSTDIQSNGNRSPETNIDSNVETTPPPTTTPVNFREATPQVPSIPDTIPPPTTTRFTPTLTRIVTSVTESGTTERQIIAVNRVPYIALAALRGQTVYPGPLVYNRHSIVPTEETILHKTTSLAIPVQPESTTKSLAEKNTISLTIQGKPKLEKVMEVNRITLVTLKEEMSLGTTRAMSGNETTERIFSQGKSDKATDKLSQVTQMKNVTAVGGSLTVAPAANYTTDMSREIFASFSTPPISLEETTHLENAIDVQDEILSVKSHNPPTTSSSSLDTFSTDTPPVTEQILSNVTSKQTDSVDEASSVGPLNNRRRPNSGRKPGIDDFRRRRIRPTFSTKSAEAIASSTPSTISQNRRGQRKRPRPYRPTSTTVADEEARVLPDPDDSSAKHGAVSADQNNGHRRTFIPKRGQRRRPRPDVPTSTSTNPDELINPLQNTGGENIVLVTENIANKTVGFIPKRGNRRRGTTQKPTTETSNLTSATTLRDENGTLSTGAKKLKDTDKLFSVLSTDPNMPDSSDSIKSSTQGVDTFISEPKSVFDPEENHRYISNSTESNLKSELSDHIEVSTIRHSHRTGSFPLRNTSPYSELLLHLTSDLNSTENATEEGDPQAKEMTSSPSSTLANTESVTPSSTKASSSASDKSGAAGSDRVRIKKRRRRPQPAQNGNTLEESARERKVLSGNEVHNDIQVSDLNAGRNISSSTPEENAVTPFATAALLGREDYEIRTPSSIGEFVTTVDREGKHVVKISVLNDPNSIAAPIKKSESFSDRGNSDDDNLTAHNPSNNYEKSSYDSELTTVENSDLNTDGSGYATENEGRNSIYPPSDSSGPRSEDYDTSLTSSVDFQTEGHGEGISHVNSSNASTRQNPKKYFITSVDFTADPADEQTLGSTAATDKNKQGSANPEGKTRHLGRRKRPSSTTEGPQVLSEVVTTTARNFRRPTGALYNPNRVRLRSTTSTTTTTTETPASSTGPEQERRKPGARLVRRRKYGPSANRTADSDATASEVKSSDASNNAPTDKDGSGGRVRKFSFPRRRTTTTAPPVTTRPVAVTTLPTSGAPEETQSDIELMESKEHKFTEAEAEAELTTTKLPDLANSAVVAIHNLATVPPTTQPTPEVVKSTRTSLTTARSSSTTSSTPAASRLFPRRGSAVFASEEPPPSPSPSPRSLPGSVSLKPRPFSKTTAAPVFETDTHARTPKPRPLPVIDYEYYDDEEGILDVAPISGKVKIHSDGYIECLDRGNFPHPFSCKKFISCAKMENGELLGWEYTCPRQLSFDPIGGICNWSAGLGCKE